MKSCDYVPMVFAGLCVRQRPLLLVGVLELPSQTSEFKHSMQLRDAAGAAACVLTESSEEEGAQRAVFNSAWIGTMHAHRHTHSDTQLYSLMCVCVCCRLSGGCGAVHHGDREIPPIRFPLLPTPGPGQVHHTQTLQVHTHTTCSMLTAHWSTLCDVRGRLIGSGCELPSWL